MTIEKILYIYGTICVVMILFNIVCIFGSKINKHIIEFKSRKYYEKLKQQLVEYKNAGRIVSFSPKRAEKDFLRTINLLAFDRFMENLDKNDEYRVRMFIKEYYSMVENITRGFLRQSPTKTAYFLHLMAKYNLCALRNDDNILDLIKQFVWKSSIYCRHNAMIVLYKAGDETRVIEGIHILSDEDAYTHERILSVGLRNFHGDCQRLISALLSELDSFKPWVQQAITNYAVEACGDLRAEMLDILNNDKYDIETHLNCIRYLGVYPYKEAYPYLISYVENKDNPEWQYAAQACKSLVSYRSLETVYKLKAALYSMNWNVRRNAAESLEKLEIEYSELVDIFNGNDRYAKEMMQYFLDVRKLNEGKEVEEYV